MAHSGVQQDHHCKDCGLYFDSIKSLDVHLHYHKENLLIKWATQPDEANNNNASSNKQRGGVTTAPADSSDSMIKTEPGRGSPQPNSFNHPPTPSSYSSAPSPFQEASAQRFSPMTTGGYSVNDRTPPQQQNGSVNSYHQSYTSNFLPPTSENSGYFVEGSNNGGYILGSGVDFPSSSNVDNLRPSSPSVSSPSSSSSIGPVTSTGMYRFHPYQSQSSGSHLFGSDRNNGVTSSGPSPSSYQPPPTPHQCDKCGFVCDSSSALSEHLNSVHPSAPSPSFINNQLRLPQEAMFRNYHASNRSPDTSVAGQVSATVNVKDEPAAEILDLDSHKVHQVYQPEAETLGLRTVTSSDHSNRGGNPHSVSAMLWGNTPQNNANSQATSSTTPDFKGVASSEGMTVPQQQALTYQRVGGYPQHMTHTGQMVHPHLHHINTVPNNISSSSLPPPCPMPSSPHQHKNGSSMQQASQQTGNQTWKSNEARRPKTYNCSACNKWFTSSGHLKRHYNTTLHKNAVKQSGAPDPATQPISNHHHPGRASSEMAGSSRGTQDDSHITERSPVPAGLGPQMIAMTEDSSRSDDASSNSNFDRITPSLQHGGLLPLGNQQVMSPPNLMAGPPITMEAQTGGLQFLSSSSYSSENNLLQDPSNSVHTSPVPTPQLPPEVVLQPQVMTQQHPYMLSQVVSPPCPQPPSHHLIHHPILQHQSLHPSRLPTPPSTLQMANLGEMYSPNGQPPHISTLQHHHPVLPHSINNHLITITGNCGSSGGNVSPLSLHDEQQFLFPISSSPQQDSQPLPSFAQIGHHPFGANFGGLTYSMVNTGPTTAVVDDVGGLLNDSVTINQQISNLKQSDAYNNNTYWINNLEKDHVLMDDNSDNAIQSDSNGSGGDENISPVRTPDCQTSTSGDFEKPVKNIVQTVDVKHEDDITSTGLEEVINHNNNNNNNNIGNNDATLIKHSMFKSLSISTGDLHKCIDCDKVFNKACYLTQHNKSFHSGHKPYKCDRCGKRFTAEFMYQQHLGKHAGEKPYKCEICPKQFNHKTDLRRHMCLHTGEKPYACHVCGKGFIRKDHMLKHCETHRRKTAHIQHSANIPVVTAVAQ